MQVNWGYLGIWQLKDLNDAMSSVEVAGSREVDKLMLAVVAEASDESLASEDKTGKADMYSRAPLVGEAKGLSGRLCSKLHSIRKIY